MAKDTVTIKGIEFTRYPKHLGSGDDRKCIGYAYLPTVPSGLDEDGYAEWLGEMVEQGVFTWKQIANGLYNIVLQQFSKILAEYQSVVEGKKFVFVDIATKHWDVVGKCNTHEEAIAKAREIWESQKGDASSWKAEDHILTPADVR